ncbi:hypothetical protein GLOIN_2v62441 [Rhizophagus irregularis DAOM 181602=DAOM 197198]|uniref:Uncharacterized protein n=1 Tax=Rhizophagus irregularis (strain DAOM 181602 / DAOM 197198 / MUCL 43194) TaxID=747089 RepID=A0A2P4Q101_RHIID|nr:hypothetical protein GLOIN_2v62441 [Rhizophagus irregularis DAOM 181602=DAOM 197198]POG71288.1 hypothetical protein GLOIN_2v62441 [Rhizophagus irregularis DAOM 181602=DAOM 197198]|eukprot:XP_025178154.1 hypothetical protein GLOIN_2v62441 [Rhizophagus irregularis DAOM 181602=DAOM 197198]
MVRLAFCSYTQICRSICTSEPLRASIRVSSTSPYSDIVYHLSGPSNPIKKCNKSLII